MGHPPSSAWSAPPRWHDHRTRHHGPPVGWITVALSLVAVGVAVLLSNAGVITLTVGAALAAVLAVIGAGLVVSAFTGRSWGLILLGVLLLPVVATAGVVDEPLSGGVGDRTEAPAAAQDVQPSYDLGMGQLTLDLTQAHLGAALSRVHATVAFGELVVLVPADLPVVVHGHAGAGTVELFGRAARGVRISEDARDGGTTGENPLTLDLGVGVGQVRLVRSDAGTR